MKTRTPGWPFFTVFSLGIAAGILIGILLARVGPGMLNPEPGTPTPSSTAASLLVQVSPSAAHTTLVPSQPAYPPPRLLTDTALAYPYPMTPSTPIPLSTPVPSSTPTVYRASIQTLSPTEWMAVASQMAPTPTLVYSPLIPKHDLHITFVDRLHGWITGSTEWGEGSISALAATSDGGTKWQALPVPSPDRNFGRESTYFGNFTRIRLLFTDAKIGWWAYQNWLFQTRDGGQTWRQEHPRGTITQMGKAVDDTSWALEQAANHWTLWKITGDAYNKWTKFDYQFPFAMDKVYLSIIDGQHAWMTYGVSTHQGGPNVDSHLYVTRDGGKNWASVSLPTPCDTLPLAISAADAQELWIGCGVFGIAVFKSPDGGASWYEMKRDKLGGLTSLTAISKSLVFMTTEGVLSVTHNGGETWQYTPISCISYSPNVFFIDESYGWAACDSAINRTTDGGRNWECINLPGENACQLVVTYPTDTPSP